MTPRVSIVIPTYNRAGLLPGAVESCLRQDFKELEVIIVNDGSSDNTLRVARELVIKDSRVIVLTQANQGLPAALNKGFAKARGEFLTWSSDDNRYEPSAVGAMVGYLEKHPDCGLVYTDFQLVDESGGVKQKVERRPPEELASLNVVGACFLYRRAVAERVGRYDPARRYVEDWDYWLRLSTVAPIRRLSGVYYNFLDHPENLSNRRQREVLEATLEMRRHTPHPEARRPALRKPLARRLASLYWEMNRPVKAMIHRVASWIGI